MEQRGRSITTNFAVEEWLGSSSTTFQTHSVQSELKANADRMGVKRGDDEHVCWCFDSKADKLLNQMPAAVLKKINKWGFPLFFLFVQMNLKSVSLFGYIFFWIPKRVIRGEVHGTKRKARIWRITLWKKSIIINILNYQRTEDHHKYSFIIRTCMLVFRFESR